MTSEESFLTRAPMTPSEVNRRYSNGLDFEVVFRNGYKKSGMCATHISKTSSVKCAENTYHSETGL